MQAAQAKAQQEAELKQAASQQLAYEGWLQRCHAGQSQWWWVPREFRSMVDTWVGGCRWVRSPEHLGSRRG